MKKRTYSGFTLIEVVIFIVVTSLLATTILQIFATGLQKTPSLQQNYVALETAAQCLEWFIGQREYNNFTTLTCNSTTVPSFCTTPTGYSTAVSIVCTTINSDANYKTITITVTGSGSASLTSLVGNY